MFEKKHIWKKIPLSAEDTRHIVRVVQHIIMKLSL